MGVFPFYPRGWSFQVSGFDPDRHLAAVEIRVLRRARAQRAAGLERVPWRYSLTAGLVWTRLDRALARAITELEAALVTDPDTAEPSFRVSGPRKTYGTAQEMYADLADVWKRCSQQMAHLAQGNGAVYPMLQARRLELEAHGVRFFDLTGLFEDETETIYVDSCRHINARGNERMVHEVARELASALR